MLIRYNADGPAKPPVWLWVEPGHMLNPTGMRLPDEVPDARTMAIIANWIADVFRAVIDMPELKEIADHYRSAIGCLSEEQREILRTIYANKAAALKREKIRSGR